MRTLRPSQFQLNSGSTSDSEKTFKFKPRQLTVTSPLAPASSSTSSNNSPSNNISNNSTLKTTSVVTTKDSDGESSNSNSGSLFANDPFMRGFSRDDDIKDTTLEKKDENLDPLTKLSSTGSSGGALPKSNLFIVKAAILSSGSGFVFGKNIGERVTGQSSNVLRTTTKNLEDNEEEKKLVDEQESSCNGAGSSASGLFFSNVATNSNNAEAIESKRVDGKSLLEATRQYEESKCSKLKFYYKN